MRVAVLDDYLHCAEAFGDLALGPDAEVTFYPEAIAPDRLVEEVGRYGALVLMRERTRFPRSVLEQLSNLRLIVTNGRVNSAVDHVAAHELGITYCGTGDFEPRTIDGPGLSSPAEMAWGLIFAITKRTSVDDRGIRAGGWQSGFPVRLYGQTLGLAGLGHLGGMMVAPARAFGMRVIAWSTNLTAGQAAAYGVEAVTKEQLLAESDVMGIFLRLSDRTRGLFGAEDLARMKPSAFVVNISRGPIIDEGALIDALVAGRIAGAGLDVYATEPLPIEHPFRSLENVVLTPHIGYITESGFRIAYHDAAEDVAAFIAGAPIRVLSGKETLR